MAFTIPTLKGEGNPVLHHKEIYDKASTREIDIRLFKSILNI